MQIKQLYASLEIAEDEIRLLISEYYMSRFNVLRVETVKINNIINRKQLEKPALISANITRLIANAEAALSLKIKRVILTIPSVNVKCVKRRVNVNVEEGSRRILMSHIRKGIRKAIDFEMDEQYEFVNVGSIKYIVGGISTRTAPLDEKADMFTMEVDLLYADKNIVHSYVKCVENTGVSVLDICLDSFAMAEETACFENSMDKYLILVNLQKNDTCLSLFYKGRLIESDNLHIGYGHWIKKLHQKYRFTLLECESLILENCFDDNGNYDDIVSYIWLDHNEHQQLTKKQIYQVIEDEVYKWITTLNEICNPIKEVDQCKIVLSGAGSDIVGIKSVLKNLNVPSQIYIPSTVGAREGKLVVCLGSLYCTKKWQNIKNVNEVSIEYSNMTAREVQREDEIGFTKKLRNILQVKQ